MPSIRTEKREPLARFGGTSYLETVEQTTMKSLPHSFLYRELGLSLANKNGRVFGVNSNCDDIMWSACIIQRQLLKGRGPRSVSVPLRKLKPSRNGRMRGGTGNGGRGQFELSAAQTAVVLDISGLGGPSLVIIDDFLFLRNEESLSYDCMVYDQDKLLRKKYSIPAKKNWKNWTLSEMPAQPLNTTTMKEFQILYVLEDCRRVVRAYNLDSGELVYKQLLDEEIKYATLEYSDSRNEVWLQSVKDRLPKTLKCDCIMIDNTFKPHTRWQMLSSAISSNGKVEQVEDMIYLTFESRLEICDLDAALRAASTPSTAGVKSVNGDTVPVTHLITTKPEVLYSVETRSTMFNGISDNAYPPHYLLNRGNGIFKVYDTQWNETSNNHGLVSLDGHDEETVHFHPDGSPRLLVAGLQSLRVVSIQRRDSPEGFTKSELVEEFHVKFTDRDEPVVLNPPELRSTVRDSAVEPSPGTVSSRPRRASRRVISYQDMEGSSDVLICSEYCSSLDSLLIMKIMPESLRFYFYDNQNWNLISTLNGMEHKIGKLDIVQPGIFTLAVSSQRITVRKNTTANSEVILIPLLKVNSSFLMD